MNEDAVREMNKGAKERPVKKSMHEELLAWYDHNKRDLPWRRTGDPYAIWVSEVMLQQTQVKTVIPYYQAFLRRFPTVKDLAQADLDEVYAMWNGLGYYSRARRLWEGARYIHTQRGGTIPGSYSALLEIPGIGEYTAGAVASIAFGQAVPAIDGNVKRVLARRLAWRDPVETMTSTRHFKEQLSGWQPSDRPGDFNQALMELGATVCTPKSPQCPVCPLSSRCEGYSLDQVAYLPVKKRRADPKEVVRLTFVLKRGEKVFLQKRPARGMLAELWEFPGVEVSPEAGAISSLDVSAVFGYYQTGVGIRLHDEEVKEDLDRGIVWHGPATYVFSHRRWQLYWLVLELAEEHESLDAAHTGYFLKEEGARYEGKTEGYWADICELKSFPLPVAFSGVAEDLTGFVP